MVTAYRSYAFRPFWFHYMSRMSRGFYWLLACEARGLQDVRTHLFSKPLGVPKIFQLQFLMCSPSSVTPFFRALVTRLQLSSNFHPTYWLKTR